MDAQFEALMDVSERIRALLFGIATEEETKAIIRQIEVKVGATRKATATLDLTKVRNGAGQSQA